MDIGLKIVKINKFNQYVLQDTKTKEEFKLILEFYGMFKPKVDDILLIDKRLLDHKNEWFSQPYAFEIFNDDEDDLKEIDLVGLLTKNKKYILKRIYG